MKIKVMRDLSITYLISIKNLIHLKFCRQVVCFGDNMYERSKYSIESVEEEQQSQNIAYKWQQEELQTKHICEDIEEITLRKNACSHILKILPSKTEIFQIKNSDIFYISAQNIDCGYSLEPPRRGGSNEYPIASARRF